jgi:FkbM family methyltransferase
VNARRLAGKVRRRVVRLRSRDRERYFARAASRTPWLAVEAENAVYLVSTRDRNIGRRLFVNHYRKEFGHLRRALAALEAVNGRKEAGTMLDVGANIGTTAIPAIVEHGFDRVLALEPSPESFLLLELNIRANGLGEQIHALQVAASDAPGLARFDTASANSGAHRVVEASALGETVIDVEATTLDRLAQQEQFDPALTELVWMDVEGHEGRVLAGASCVLERGIPIVAEVAPARDEERGLTVELAVDLLARHYTHFLDLRVAWQGQPPLRTDLRAVVAEYGDGFTDILALRT